MCRAAAYRSLTTRAFPRLVNKGLAMFKWIASGRALACGVFLMAVTTTGSAKTIFDDDWTPPPQQAPTTPPVEPPPAPQTAPEPAPATPAPATPAPQPVTPPPTAVPSAPVRLPVPAAADQAKTRKIFKEVFAKDLADRNPMARSALARKLIDEAEKDESVPTDQFVLLVGAADAGREALDLPLSFEAADALAKKFQVDGVQFKAQCALEAQFKAATPPATANNCRAALAVVDQLIAADSFSDALRLLGDIRPAATIDPSLTQDVQDRFKQVDAYRQGLDAIRGDFDKLKADPKNPAANLALGNYLCLIKGDWHDGLPRLAVGSDPKLKGLAAAELRRPTSADGLAAVADDWWELAAGVRDIKHQRLVEHAAEIYADAKAAGLSGLRLEFANKRITEAQQPLSRERRVISLLTLIDPAKDAVNGDWRFVNGQLVSGDQVDARLRIPFAVPDEYDLHYQFTRLSGDDFVMAILSHAGKCFDWVFGANGNTLIGFEEISGKHADANPTHLRATASDKAKGRLHDMVVQIRNGYIAAYIDGRPAVRYSTDYSDLSITEGHSVGQDAIGLCTWKTPTAFNLVELVEVTGHGHPLPHGN